MNALPKVLLVGLACIVTPMVMILLIGLTAGAGRPTYELLRELFVPMIGPLVAVFIPLMLFFILPMGENRQKTALDLCQHYFSEEMREARNTGWRYFVIDQRRANESIRAERHEWFYKYLTNPEAHGEMEPGLDIIFQKAARVLDFFALVNEVLGRHSADAGIVKSFLVYYYLWWRDEIMVPMRTHHTIDTNDLKVKPGWWDPLVHLDRLAKR
jgi:hypothetical protein